MQAGCERPGLVVPGLRRAEERVVHRRALLRNIPPGAMPDNDPLGRSQLHTIAGPNDPDRIVT